MEDNKEITLTFQLTVESRDELQDLVHYLEMVLSQPNTDLRHLIFDEKMRPYLCQTLKELKNKLAEEGKAH
ncbi:hypothetical protein [Vibrio owensii]|uniref:hypothetical protein n=1 Tax=Vibrio owensii TaxID=696485 RepID=UPI004067DB99